MTPPSCRISPRSSSTGTLEPRVERGGSRWPRRPCGCPRRRRSIAVGAGAGQRKGAKGSGGPTSASSPVRAAKMSIRWTRRARRASAADRVRHEVVGEARPGRPRRPRRRPDEPDAARAASTGRSSVARSGRPTSWSDGWLRARREVEHVVGRLVEDAHRVEPPQDVAPAVDARQPRVPADRERHRPARGVDLVGELDAGGRGAHDQHAALRGAARGLR